MKTPYLIVSGDFVKAGGMNQPNYELARYLADEGFQTHLVGYRVADRSRQPSRHNFPSRAQAGRLILSVATAAQQARPALGAGDCGEQGTGDRQWRLLRLG